MENLLKSKIEELEIEIERVKDQLKETKENSRKTKECYYYEYFTELYAELNKLQFALDVLGELLDEIEEE